MSKDEDRDVTRIKGLSIVVYRARHTARNNRDRHLQYALLYTSSHENIKIYRILLNAGAKAIHDGGVYLNINAKQVTPFTLGKSKPPQPT